jgi:uridine kinase
MTTNSNIKQWSSRSPEEREQIRVNQERASYMSPFRGKNRAQRYRLHNGFNAMASARTKRRLS